MRVMAMSVTLLLSLAASGTLAAQADHVGHGFGEVLRIKAMVQQDSLYRAAPRDTTLLLLIERDDTGRLRVVGTAADRPALRLLSLERGRGALSGHFPPGRGVPARVYYYVVQGVARSPRALIPAEGTGS